MVCLFMCTQKVSPLVSILNSLGASLEKSLRSKPSEELQLLKDCLPSTTSTSSATAGTPAPAAAASRTGLLLHKRFTNLPIQLVGALHRNLEEDVSWAQQQASDEDDELALDECESSSSSANKPSSAKKIKRQANFFAEARYVLVLCECAVPKDKSAYTLTDNACYDVLGSCSDIIFASFEDEVYLQHASAAVLFRPPKQHCLTDLVALLVPISKLKTCVNGICALIPEE